jgi:ligand-binding sensor domain-containing protein/two-component sensor histidine kinase
MIPSLLRLVCGWLWFCLALWPPPAFAEPLPIKTWTAAHGLAHNHIIRIRRDARGFLWFCTLEGLSRFDGRSFTTFDTLSGLPHLTVTDVLEARDGSWWVATNGGGIARFQNLGQLTGKRAPRLYQPGALPAQQRVNALFQDHQGRIYAGTDAGIFCLAADGLETGQFRRLDDAQSPYSAAVVNGFAEDAAGHLWISSWSGLYRLSPTQHLTHFSIHRVQEYDYVLAVVPDRNRRLWLAARDKGVVVLDPSRVPPDAVHLDLSALPSEAMRWFTPREGLPDSSIYSLHQAADGSIWIGSEQHLTVWDGNRLRVIGDNGPRQKISKVSLDTLTEDAAGNIWAGGMLGAVQVVRNGLSLWSTADGLSTDIPHAVYEAKDGALLVITNDYHLNRFDGEEFQSAPLPVPPELLYHESTLTAFQDRQGEWWIPAKNGIWRFAAANDPRQLARQKPQAIYGQPHGLPPEVVGRMYEDASGDIWLTTAGQVSLARWERQTGRFRLFSQADGVADKDPPVAFCESPPGTLWMGLTGGGLLRYRNGMFRRFGAADGIPGGALQSLFLDQPGRLWLGSDTDGAAWLEGLQQESPVVRRLSHRDGLSSDNVLAFAEDRSGRIYFGTGRGLDWLDPATGQVTNWRAPSELNINPISLLHTDRQGVIWAGGLGGLLRFAPEMLRPAPARVFISELVSGATSLLLPLNGTERLSGLELTARQNRLRISLSSPWFAFGQQPLYQYKLAGDTDWSMPSSQRDVTFANLAPGRYQFLARAVTFDGQPGDETLRLDFTVPPPVWQRWWFIGLALLALSGVGYGTFRWRLAQLLKLERMRTSIAGDLHDDIGANLTRISILSEVAKQQNGQDASSVRSLLDSIAEIARESVSSMSDIVWAINPERDTLHDLIYRMRQHAEEVFMLRNVTLDFQAPETAPVLNLDAGLRRDLYLIFKEAVNNAARHSGCTCATIEVRLADAQLHLTISDNGRGFDSARTSEGNGLHNMHKRATAQGGRLEIAAGAGRGTRIHLSAPLTRALAGK